MKMYEKTSMLSLFVFIFCLLGLSEQYSAYADENSHRLSIHLSVSIVRSGGEYIPVFSIDMENMSTDTVRVLDVVSRPDLQYGFCNILVSPNDRSFEFERIISNFGTISEHDYVILQSAERKVIQIPSLPINYDQFEPGEYSALLVYLTDPDTASGEVYRSSVEFMIPNS